MSRVSQAVLGREEGYEKKGEKATSLSILSLIRRKKSDRAYAAKL